MKTSGFKSVSKGFFATVMLAWAALSPVSGDALAGGTDGVPIQVTVLDLDGNPISTAVVRHPEEADRHRVNALTGVWEGDVLYLPDGSEMVFVPGMTLTLEVSAPGYVTQIVQYDVRKRRNRIEVTLPVLVVDESDIEEPLIQFGRDKPVD